MRRILITVVASIELGGAFCAVAQIRAEVHLDKQSYLAGEPVYVVWDYTNLGSTAVPFDRFYPYCPEPEINAPLPFAEPTVFPYPHDGIINCESFSAQLKPQETYEKKFLLNHRFDLRNPGEYEFVVSLQPGIVRSGLPEIQVREFPTRKLKLVLRPSSEAALRAAYQSHFDALTDDSPNRLEALRALADSGQGFVEAELLRFSSDPRSGSDFQDIANDGLARLRTPAACARLAELADHPELHHQEIAIEQLGQCGDPGYMLFLFRLADQDGAMRQFALLAAGEAGGEAAVDRLLRLHLQGSVERETQFYALARTGSDRAAKAIIDALPFLHDDNVRYAALQSLATLTHRESRGKDFVAQSLEWKQWWATSQKKDLYKPRDWRLPLTALN